MIQINDWIRYEVNSKGQPAKDGEDLRAGALTYIRLKNYGHATNRGLQKLQRLAKGKTMEVVGIFTQFLQLAANNRAENRGILREQKDGRPATIAELAEILPATAKQITFAIECLSNPAVSWILADKEGFPENSGDSRKSADALLTQHNTTQVNTTQHNAPEKERFLNFVFLTKEEYQKLVGQFGTEKTVEKIATLNDYIGSSGRRYKSHYFTILNWERKNQQSDGKSKHRLFPIAGKICSKDGCKLPAVYKDTSGSYDNYSCEKHLPTEVKEIYGH